jgi:hypothetical protein
MFIVPIEEEDDMAKEAKKQQQACVKRTRS